MTAITSADAERTLPNWRVVERGLEVDLKAKDFRQAFDFLTQIAELAETQQHHPDFNVRYNRIRMRVMSHDVNGLSDRDITFAKAADALIDEAGLERSFTNVQELMITIDTLDIAKIKPFWLAVLGYEQTHSDLLRDPNSTHPSVWFQPMGEPRNQRSRTHIDVLVPVDERQARMDAAIAAGGTLLTDEFAPSFWVLADAEGNEACLCTWEDRGE
ncbi:MAG: 4a-hydroxytetrahydrobiopterin dehydratase [Gulosibacter sp.]|uniref:4a-hydroxytetrahydrobiopterin dehydratase n=1 Tax=Gulosibacter sp. TaxID=2817531 RepID=UPI003F9316FF